MDNKEPLLPPTPDENQISDLDKEVGALRDLGRLLDRTPKGQAISTLESVFEKPQK
jgi:hypothetical protein